MYNLIYADPPWKFNEVKTGGSLSSSAAAKYLTTSIDDLKAMNIPSIAADDCALVMWWVGAMPQEAIDLVSSWGFNLKNMNGFVWQKLTVKHNPFFGMGHYSRAGSESCIIAIKGRPKVISHSIRAVQSHPIMAHSQKPDLFRRLCVDMFGDVPRVELFARARSPGWDVFGNEVEGSIVIQ
jgi:N6-adenosine-specific RNA methylase IME4